MDGVVRLASSGKHDTASLTVPMSRDSNYVQVALKEHKTTAS